MDDEALISSDKAEMGKMLDIVDDIVKRIWKRKKKSDENRRKAGHRPPKRNNKECRSSLPDSGDSIR